MISYTPYAFWPDTFMCPVSEIDQYRESRGSFEIVYVYEYDDKNQPYKWLTQFQYNKLNVE